MTTVNTDFNTELLDQELNFDELQEVNGAVPIVFGLWAVTAVLGVLDLTGVGKGSEEQ